MSDLSWMRPKLAELCGELLCGEGTDLYYPHSTENWRPDEDVAQAVRCLETMHRRVELVLLGTVWQATFTDRVDPPYGIGPLPRAICLAIAAALGWDASGDGRGTT